MKTMRIGFIIIIVLMSVQIGSSTCCPECGDDCSGSGYDPYGGSYIPTSVVSISHTITTPSSSSQPSGTSVDYHVQSKADLLEGYVPLKVHLWDESYATQGVTATGWEWDLGDGTKETKKDFTHTYATPGTFKIIPKVHWSDGKVSTGKAASIRAYPSTGTPAPGGAGSGSESEKPSGTDVDYHVKSKADKLEGTAPIKIHFSDESYATKGIVPTGYEWDMGDGSSEKSKEFDHTYQKPGTYTVTPKITFSDGHVVSGSPAKIVVTEGEAPTVPKIFEPTVSPTPTQTGDTLPDLTVTELKPSSEVKPGEKFSVEVTVENIGKTSAGAFTLGGLVFPKDDYQKEIKLDDIQVSGLGAGEKVNKTMTGEIPADSPSGAYDLKVYADNSNYTDAGQVTESNENNNEKWFMDVKPATLECEYSCNARSWGVDIGGRIEGGVAAAGESNCDKVISISWDFGDGTTVTTANNEVANHTFSTPGTYTPKFSMKWESGKNFDDMCEANIVPVEVKPPTTAPTTVPPTTVQTTVPPTPVSQPPEVDYYVIARDNPAQGEAPLSVDFQDMSYATQGVTPVSWKWDLGDGSSASEKEFSHTYQTPGVYHVTDTVTFSDGYVLSGALTPDIRVIEYYPKMTAEPSEGDAPLDVTFRDSSSATTGVYPVAWAWEFNDGYRDVTSNQQAFVHTFTRAGTYEWSGGVVFSDGKTATDHGTITVRKHVIDEHKINYHPEIIPDPQNGAAPLNENFQDASYATNGVTVAHMTSDLGDGTIITDQKTFTHVYENPGTYTLTHTVTFSDGHVSVVGGPIKVYETIKYFVQISVNPLYGIAPLPISVTDNSYATGGVYVTGRAWDYGDETSGEGKVAQHTYEKAGTYTVKEKVTFSDGHVQESDTRTVVVVEPEKSEGVETSDWEVVKTTPIEYYLVQVAEPREGLAPLTVRFEDQSSTNKPDVTASAWKWDLGDGESSTDQKFTHEYTQNGTYEIKVDVTFSDGHQQAGEPISVEILKEGIETSSFTTDEIGADIPEGGEAPPEVTPSVSPEATQIQEEQPPMLKEAEPSDVECIEDSIFKKTNVLYPAGYTRDPLLDEIARAHSANMCSQDKNKGVKGDTFNHNLDGKGPADRLNDAGYKWMSYSENIAFNECKSKDCESSAQNAIDQWMASTEGHRETILNIGKNKQTGETITNTNIGVGVSICTENCECESGCFYYTQVFATPQDKNQKPLKAKITVTSDPAGGEVMIDGVSFGITPSSEIEVLGGSHQIDVKKEGFISTPQKVTVSEGETKTVPVPLTAGTTTPPPPTGKPGTITVTSVPAGATVSFDNNVAEKGITPTGPIEAPVGSHEVLVQKDGYKTGSTKVTVEEGKDTPVTITLEKEAGPGDQPQPPVTPPVEPGNPPVNPVTTGAISFISTPPAATVQLGGVILNQLTPFQIEDVPAGPYQVKFILVNQESPIKEVIVVAGQTVEVSHTFDQSEGQEQPGQIGPETVPGTGTVAQPGQETGQPGTGGQQQGGSLTLETIPSGSDVYINNWPVGKTPISGMGTTAGTYLIAFVKNGYKPEIVTAVIPPGGQVFISRSLTPLVGEKPTGPVVAGDLGSLEIISTPEAALVFIDGFQVNGKTPIGITDLQPGQYEVKVTHEGYTDITQQATVTAGQKTTVNAVLTQAEDNFDPLANLGTIKVTSTPPGAEIFLNGFLQPVKTPTDLTLINPGKHYVEVKMQGYDTFRQDITMSSGGTVTVNAVLVAGGDEDATFTVEGKPASGIPGEGTPTGGSAAGAEPVGDTTGVKIHPELSGSRIIWVQMEGERSVVYGFDTGTGKTGPLSNDTGSQENPSISGDYAVWETSGDGSEIILKDLKSGVEKRITEDSAKQYAPATDGISIVYIEEGGFGSTYDLVLYTIGSGEKKIIATGKSEKSSPVVNGDYVVYEDMKTGKSDLYTYQISTGTDGIISEPGEKRGADIDGTKVVYEDYQDGNADVYLFDIQSGTKQVIASGPGDQVRPSLSGDMVVYEDLTGDRPVVTQYIISTGKVAPVTSVTGPAYPKVRDNVLIYLDKDGTILSRKSLS